MCFFKIQFKFLSLEELESIKHKEDTIRSTIHRQIWDLRSQVRWVQAALTITSALSIRRSRIGKSTIIYKPQIHYFFLSVT